MVILIQEAVSFNPWQPSTMEKIPTLVFPDSADVNHAVATRIAELVRAKASKREKCVLGLATGSTPTGVYDMVIGHVERALLASIMTRAEGNQTQAADMLGMNRTTLRAKLVKHKLV